MTDIVCDTYLKSVRDFNGTARILLLWKQKKNNLAPPDLRRPGLAWPRCGLDVPVEKEYMYE